MGHCTKNLKQVDSYSYKYVQKDSIFRISAYISVTRGLVHTLVKIQHLNVWYKSTINSVSDILF